MSMEIKEWRAEIDAIDEELLRLLNRRAKLAVQVGMLKRGEGWPLCDPQRECEVLERARHENNGPLDDRAVARIFRRIIRESRRVEASSFETADEVSS